MDRLLKAEHCIVGEVSAVHMIKEEMKSLNQLFYFHNNTIQLI